jgi:hypothetical protein
MIATGLSAMPIAKGNNSLIVLPIFFYAQICMDIRTTMMRFAQWQETTPGHCANGYFRSITILPSFPVNLNGTS